MSLFLWLTSATLNIVVATILLCVIISGQSAYRYMGAGGAMARAAGSGAKWPTILTSMALVLYLVFAAYCLSAAGIIHLPASTAVLIGVTVFYFLRASVLLFDRVINPPLPTFVLMTSYAALLIGLCQALGLIANYI